MTNPVLSKNIVDAINLCIDTKLTQSSFITYAEVTAVNDNFTIDAKPLAKNKVTNKKINTSEYKEFPTIKGIPYLYIAQPSIGDTCILLHLDDNAASGNNIEEIDGVRYIKGSAKPHSLNNCVAICGFKNIYKNLEATVDDNNAVLVNYLKSIPVGGIYITTSSVSPASLVDGSWEAFGAGRVLVGAGTGTDSNGTSKSFLAGMFGGEYTHTLTINEMPTHSHPTTTYADGEYEKQTEGTTRNINTETGTHIVSHTKYSVPIQYGSAALVGSYSESEAGRIAEPDDPYEEQVTAYNDYYPTANYGVPKQGGGQSHNNLQPYFTVYMWKKIS